AYANIQLNEQRKSVIDSFGRTIYIPKDVTRVVTDGKHTLGEMLALGIPPIGAAMSLMKDDVIYHQRLQNICSIGKWADPTKIAQLEPEIVLLSYKRSPQDLKELRSIAPTVVMKNALYRKNV
ncbi:MAG: Fe3+-citrate ABC transporter substrate-binding protein, partial [Kurthia sp.]